MLKKCQKGHERKLLPSGSPYCPTCQKERGNRYLLRNPEKNKVRYKKYRDENAFKLIERRQSVKLYKKAYDKQRQLNQQHRFTKQRKEYYEKHKEKWHTRRSLQHPILENYRNMLRRCSGGKDPRYKYWSGKGVKVCERWLGPKGFENFVEDMYSSWEPGKSIDRYPDRDGDYKPSNCRWATPLEQNQNTRTNLNYRISFSDDSPINDFGGDLITLKQFAEQTNLPLIVAKYRYSQNMDAKHILDHNLDNRYYKYEGHMYNMTELCLISGLKFSTMQSRIKNYGWSVRRAIEVPLSKF